MSSEEQAVMLFPLIEQLRRHMEKSGYSPAYIERVCVYSKECASYLDSIGIYDVREVTFSALSGYIREIYWKNSSRGKPYSLCTVATKIGSVRLFFRWLLSQNIILSNPALHVRYPKVDKIPRTILSLSEVQALLSQPDLSTLKGIRDRAILELFYSTAIRRKELADLDMFDADVGEEVLFIRKGKGGKDRMVPLGRWASFYLQKYLERRKKIAKRENALFVNVRGSGKRISCEMLNIIVREYAKRAGIEKRVSCHILRHTCAVHMLEGGADVRSIQEFLGHRFIETTQVYLSVSREELKKVHRQCHPRGKRAHSENE
jgi:integrase/recombinase XerD